jgi:hypothetical protein
MFRLGVQRNAENIGFASTGASLLTPYGMALIIFWIVEGVFPVTYFAIWALGLVGLVITGLSSED